VDFLLWLDVVGFPIETHAILIDVLMDFPHVWPVWLGILSG
jgi:hypothetical protein